MEINPLTLDEIKSFIDKHGKKAGEKILSHLGEIYPELQAIFGTDIGREILLEDLKRLEQLFGVVYRETATDLELAEFRYLRDNRIPKLLSKLQSYMAKTQSMRRT